MVHYMAFHLPKRIMENPNHRKRRKIMLQFLKQYIKNPRNIGAIAPSSRLLAQNMMRPIDFRSAKCIVEFGPGTGVFTEKLLCQKKDETVLILIEQNKEFCRMLRKRFGNRPNFYIIRGSAENAVAIVKKHGFSHADYIVSGLPFTSLPREVSLKIFKAAKRLIAGDGTFITFQYTMLKRKFFEEHFKFKDCIHVLRNLPPAYVFVMGL